MPSPAAIQNSPFFTSKLSLTESNIIQPIQNYSQSKVSHSIWDSAQNFVNAEIITRIIGVATSFFTAIDAICYLGNALHKSALYTLYLTSIISLDTPPTKTDILSDFALAALFTIATVVGSIVGVIYPGIFTKEIEIVLFSEEPSSCDVDDVKEELEEKAIEYDLSLPLDIPASWEKTSDTVQDLWAKAQDKSAFQDSWQKSTLYDKRVFTQLLDQDLSDKGEKAKANLVHMIYKRYNPSEDEVIASSDISWPKHTDGVFFHATPTEESLESILTSKKVEVREDSGIKGAFVSSKGPVVLFGDYILVFKRCIERMSVGIVNSGGSSGWAAFQEDIPVNQQTLQKIYLNLPSYFSSSKKDQQCKNLAQKIKDWTGRDVPVEKYSFSTQFEVVLEPIFPREWIEDSNKTKG